MYSRYLKTDRRTRLVNPENSTLSLTSLLDVSGWLTPLRGRATPLNGPVRTVWKAVWPNGRSGWARKISPGAAQTVAIHYASYSVVDTSTSFCVFAFWQNWKRKVLPFCHLVIVTVYHFIPQIRIA